MVKARYNDIRHVSPANAPAKKVVSEIAIEVEVEKELGVEVVGEWSLL